MSDILVRSLATGIDVAITISVDGIAGEPPETFTISSRPPAVSSPSDPPFLFRDTTVTIIDADSEFVINLIKLMVYRKKIANQLLVIGMVTLNFVFLMLS